MFCCHLLESCSFLIRDRKGVSADGRGGGEQLRAVEGGETITGIRYMKKECIECMEDLTEWNTQLI